MGSRRFRPGRQCEKRIGYSTLKTLLMLTTVAQLAQLQEHRARIGVLRQVGERLAQLRDHRRARQPEERVDLPLDRERRHVGRVGVLALERVEHRLRPRVVGLAVQREAQVVLDVVVARIDQRRLGQPRELLGERLVELCRMAAVVAVAGAGVEQRVAAEERGRVGVREQADVAHRVAGRVERLELDGLADADDVARAQSPRHVRDLVLARSVRQDARAGLATSGVVAAGVVAVLVGVEDLRDLPASLPWPRCKHFSWSSGSTASASPVSPQAIR